jgi:putative ABC transport system substrate-binding protein
MGLLSGKQQLIIKGRMIRFIGILLISLFGLVSPIQAAESAANLLILFPKLNAAYDRVFAEIVDGIDSHKDAITHTYTLTKSSSEKDIQKQIDKHKIDAIIALGQSSYEIGQSFREQLPVIHGGMIIRPGSHSGISLAGSPKQFFAHLETVAPSVNRVFTVYSEENSGWLIRLAQEEAKKANIELIAIAANDIRQAAQSFRKFLDKANGSTDAIWLLLDKVLPNRTVLPLALEAAWKKNIVLFSNNPIHTKRGALFALFPDHHKMGYKLADLSLQQLSSRQPIVIPLSSLKIAVNERTASHLGLRYSNVERESFDIIYPLR